MTASVSPIITSDNEQDVLEHVKNSGSSFLLGMLALPKDRRQGMFALYAFCRAVDDIADSDWPADQRRAELQNWRGFIRDVFKGESRHPVMRLLQGPIKEYDLQEKDFQAIIEGMEMDAGEPIQRPGWAALDTYCDHVASAVGRISVRIFGESSAAGQQVAHHLGRALQLTNILRDIDEDAARGRLYMPLEALEESGITSSAIALIVDHPAFDHACRAVARQAAFHFDEADAFMDECAAKAIKPARIMRDYYAEIMRRMLQLGWQSPRERVSLGKFEKIKLFSRLWLP